MGAKESARTLWPRWPRPGSEYVDYHGQPPSEWEGAIGPRAPNREPQDADGIEVVEQSIGFATVVETHFRIRCDCGKRWWALDLEPTTCPRCQRWVSIQPAD